VSGILMMLVTGGMAASVSPTAANGTNSAFGETPIEVTTNTVTVAVQGGLAPYTYAWSKVVGDDVTITAPTGATTAFTETQPPGTTLAGTYRATVTDATGKTAFADCSVQLLFIQLD
jgi:hypothetical protein